VFNSGENQNSDVIDSTSIDMKDDTITSANEKGTFSEGISGNGTAEKGDGNISNKESQEVENEMEARDANEHSEISSNPHAKDDVAKSQNTSDEEERGNENKSLRDSEHKSLDNTLTEEENKNIPVPEFGMEDVAETNDKSEELKSETNEVTASSESIASDAASLPVRNEETVHVGSVESDVDTKMDEDTSKVGAAVSHEVTASSESIAHDAASLPVSNEETVHVGSVESDVGTKMDEDTSEVGAAVSHDDNASSESIAHDAASLPVSNEETVHDESVESDGGADSSSTELNQGPSASSEQTTDDTDENSSEFTGASNSEMLEVSDINRSPGSESQMASLKDDGGDVAKDGGIGSDSAVSANGGGSAGDQSKADAEHSAAMNENTEEDVNESDNNAVTHRSHEETQTMNKNYIDKNDSDVHDISHGGNSGTRGSLGASSEDNTEDQSSNAEGNNSDVGDSSMQGMKAEGGDDDDVSEKHHSGTDRADDAQGVSVPSPEAGTGDQDQSVEGDRQLGKSNIKHFHSGQRSFKPLPTIPSFDEEKTTNCNCSNKQTDVPPETTDIIHKHENEDKLTANATGNHSKDKDLQVGESDVNDVIKSVPGSRNNTHVSGTRVQKADIKQQSDDDDGINEPGLGRQREDSTTSTSVGSYVVLGVIMAIIVVLLGYSVLRKRRRNAQEAKSEDFGTEMSEVKKNLLPGNKFEGEIQPHTHPEKDESNAKLLSDVEYTRDNVQNGETGVAVQNGTDSEKELGGSDDSHTKEKIVSDKVGSQLEPTNSPENTLNNQIQNGINLLKEAVTPKKQETVDSPKKEDTAVTPKKQETAVTPKKEDTAVTPKKQETAVPPKKQEAAYNQNTHNQVSNIPTCPVYVQYTPVVRQPVPAATVQYVTVQNTYFPMS
jgi:hypothetical protein